jgi:hypothetical protein
MLYNIFINDFSGKFNIFGVPEEKMAKVIEAYLNGENSLTLSGKNYLLIDVSEFRIFCHDEEIEQAEKTIRYYMNNISFHIKTSAGRYLPVRTLKIIGKEVTEKFIGDSAFGEKLNNAASLNSQLIELINDSRIDELKRIKHIDFDLTRLIKLCEEMNENYKNENYLSVGMIGRTILNHVPPIFGCNSFEEVANNYGGLQKNKSFKKLMQNLNNSLKNIADIYLHQAIRKSETLPNKTQIDFGKELDVLLEEIVRLLKNSTNA